MTNWKEYSGSDDEQIAEMRNAEHGFVLRHKDGKTESEIQEHYAPGGYRDDVIESYLICKPHPLADMIIRQAQTGQPVWIRSYHNGTCQKEWTDLEPTTTPDWSIPNAEYSFVPFEEAK